MQCDWFFPTSLSLFNQSTAEADADLWFLVPLARFPDCAPLFLLRRFAIILLPLLSLVPHPLVPWAAAPVAYPRFAMYWSTASVAAVADPGIC